MVGYRLPPVLAIENRASNRLSAFIFGSCIHECAHCRPCDYLRNHVRDETFALVRISTVKLSHLWFQSVPRDVAKLFIPRLVSSAVYVSRQPTQMVFCGCCGPPPPVVHLPVLVGCRNRAGGDQQKHNS